MRINRANFILSGLFENKVLKIKGIKRDDPDFKKKIKKLLVKPKINSYLHSLNNLNDLSNENANTTKRKFILLLS